MFKYAAVAPAETASAPTAPTKSVLVCDGRGRLGRPLERVAVAAVAEARDAYRMCDWRSAFVDFQAEGIMNDVTYSVC